MQHTRHVIFLIWWSTADRTHSMFVWTVADGWCWFVPREKHFWLIAGGWFVLREKYCWLVADKPSEQAASLGGEIGKATHTYRGKLLRSRASRAQHFGPQQQLRLLLVTFPDFLTYIPPARLLSARLWACRVSLFGRVDIQSQARESKRLVACTR
jgi:hypothetical protein